MNTLLTTITPALRHLVEVRSQEGSSPAGEASITAINDTLATLRTQAAERQKAMSLIIQEQRNQPGSSLNQKLTECGFSLQEQLFYSARILADDGESPVVRGEAIHYLGSFASEAVPFAAIISHRLVSGEQDHRALIRLWLCIENIAEIGPTGIEVASAICMPLTQAPRNRLEELSSALRNCYNLYSTTPKGLAQPLTRVKESMPDEASRNEVLIMLSTVGAPAEFIFDEGDQNPLQE